MLKDLNQTLFQAASQGLSPEKEQFLKSRWRDIRDIAVQNGGYGMWGLHLLKLTPAQLDDLKLKFKETIHSIEDTHLHLEEDFVKAHPDLIGLRFLLDTNSEAYKHLFVEGNVKALFWEYNPELVSQHRAHFQEVFKFLSQHPTWSQRDPLVSEMLVGNLIALLPYFDFQNGAKIQILRYIDNAWKLVTYEVQEIPLIHKEIYAIGLIPTEDPNCRPILVFRGTPYPAARGFLEAIWSDLHPIKSIGEEIFEKGKNELALWLQGKEVVDCYGLSLGGALAYHAGNAFGEQIRVHAYAAPGLVPMKGGLSKIHGRVFFHLNDLVKSVGYHPESKHFDIYAVVSDLNLNFLTAHYLPTGLGPTLVLKVDPKHENKTLKRYCANFLKVLVSTLLFLVLLPIKTGVDLWRKWNR